jgi:hypothetical protein
MKKTTLLIKATFMSLVFYSCSKSNSPAPGPVPGSIVGNWRVVSDNQTYVDSLTVPPTIAHIDTTYATGTGPIAIEFMADDTIVTLDYTDAMYNNNKPDTDFINKYSISGNEILVYDDSTSSYMIEGTFSISGTGNTLTINYPPDIISQPGIYDNETEIYTREQ